jgi:hypothetical protein
MGLGWFENPFGGESYNQVGIKKELFFSFSLAYKQSF